MTTLQVLFYYGLLHMDIWPAKSYIHQLCAFNGYRLEKLTKTDDQWGRIARGSQGNLCNQHLFDDDDDCYDINLQRIFLFLIKRVTCSLNVWFQTLFDIFTDLWWIRVDSFNRDFSYYSESQSLSLSIYLWKQKLICTQLNSSKYWYVSLTIWFSISHLFANSVDVKKFYSTLSGATTQGQSGSVVMGLIRYSVFSKSSELGHHHQMVLCHIQDSRLGVLLLLRNSLGVF